MTGWNEIPGWEKNKFKFEKNVHPTIRFDDFQIETVLKTLFSYEFVVFKLSKLFPQGFLIFRATFSDDSLSRLRLPS